MKPPETSIIIRTYNEEQFLPALLASLKRQEYQDFETIVVDSGSLDRTRSIAERAAHKLVKIESHDFTFGYSLNVGLNAAAGRLAVIVSAHTLPLDGDWLGRLLAPLDDDQTAMVYGRQLGTAKSKFSENQDMRRTFGKAPMVLQPPHFFANNANAAIKKGLWEKHPFDENLLGLEDIEWAKHWMEQGYQVVYEPRAAIYHIHQEKWRQVRHRYYREAVAARAIGVKGRGHALMVPVAESIRLMSDLARVVKPAADDLPSEKTLGRLLKEIFRFRVNKSVGTVKGLMGGGVMQNSQTKEKILFDRTCRAVVIRGPGQASLDEIEVPEIKPGEVLIRVAYEAVCATDLEIVDGSLSYYQTGMAEYPIVPGHEFSGTVVACGPVVKDLKPGDAVVVECIQSCGNCDECRRGNTIGCPRRIELGVIGRNGGYADYVMVPGRFTHRLPPELSLKSACLCEPLAVALKGLKRLAHIWQSPPETKRCAVVGAGPLGNLLARVLHHRGHRVTMFDRDPDRLAYLQDLGIDLRQDLAGLDEFDVLMEVTGDPDALDHILTKSPAGATILLLGLPYAHRKFTFENIVAFDKTVVGSVGSSSEEFEAALQLLQLLDTRSLTRMVLPLADFATAWDHVKNRKHLKILLEVAGEEAAV